MIRLRLFAGLLLAALTMIGTARAADAPSTAATPPPEATATAIFAGGCFWCMEHPFDALDGVLSVTSGYTGGHVPSPTYEQVSSGTTGHAEAVRVVYDPTRIGYDKLLDVYWHNVDPLDAGGQFCDRGNQYRTAIFYTTEQQRELAETSKAALESSGRLPGPIATEIVQAGPFYPAEGYHQHYYKTNPLRYTYYRFACGRDKRLEELWGDGKAG
jgi:peptide-methionine (S)-S-oxide reductase